ncbi:MAG: tRNA (adenosine(37)-N6)-threonylcarbamoyltransferase complex dimerization subunit type 1 TsaB [Panacagrimonas sp.]
MRLLALDTSTEACSAALWLDGCVTERFEIAGRTHTQLMLPMVHGLMADAGLASSQLDGLVCGTGPGSFAGVRIGVGFIKGLGLALDVPVVGVSSLAMLAQAAIDQGAERVLAMIDARMSEIYFAAFTHDAGGLAADHSPAMLVAPEQVDFRAAGGWVGVGTGWGTYEAVLRSRIRAEMLSIDGTALPHAAAALGLAVPVFVAGAAASADALAPVYLRDKVALDLDEQALLRSQKNRPE